MNEESEMDLSEWELASTEKMISYSFGFLLVYFMASQFNTYVFYYYEVEIGIPVVMLGFAFIIFAVWNMINDPLLGYLTDRPFKWSQRWGYRAPWMVIGAIPYLICWWFLFAAPEALINLSDPWPIFWYFVIMACLFDTFYSLFSIHLSAGYIIHFRTDAERRRASAINATIPLILALFISFIVPIIYIYGMRDTMMLAQTMVVLLLAICVLILLPSIRESDEVKERFLRGYNNTERDSFFKSMKSAFKRNNFRSTMLIVLLATLGSTLYYASGVYFMKDILRLPLSYAIFTSLAGFIGLIIFIPFWSNVSKKYGHATTFKLSLLLITLLYLPFLWITTIWEAIIFNFIGGFIVGAYYISLGPVVADVYDECTISTGKHQEAMYAGIQTFFIRIAIIVQAIIFVMVHLATGYNPDPQVKQTNLAIWGIRIHMALLPSLCSFMAFLIMLKFYDLIGEKQKAIKRQLMQMKL